MDLRKGYLQSTYNHFIAERDKHVLDLEVYLSNQVAIGEHPNIGDEIKSKIELIDKYDSIVSTLITRFGDQMLDETEQQETDPSKN
jgi:hypothetical protein|tara:strand:+ start:636 stop:893 length:258 start_codon:yes stop_codon:yes gene_type:complete